MRTIKGFDSLSEGHWLKLFHEALKSEELSDVSVRGYLYDLNYFHKWIIEIHGQEVALEKISSSDLAAYRQYLVDAKTVHISKIVSRLRDDGHSIPDEHLARVSPLLHKHVIVNGMYDFAYRRRKPMQV